MVLLLAVLFVPGLNTLFLVSPAFGMTNLAQVAGLALAPTVIIQLIKLLKK